MQKKSPNTIKKEFALEVALEAIKKYKENEEKEDKKTVFRNTRILMGHYNELKEHCGCAIDDLYNDPNNYVSDMQELIGKLQEDIIIESIVKTRSRTYVMVKHIDTCLDVLCRSMDLARIPEKYEVFKIFYLDPETCKMARWNKLTIAAERLAICERTAARYELDMIHEMSTLLFGIGASKLVK